jgi:hypothetical protein
MLTDPDSSRIGGGMNGNIVPFVCGLGEKRREFVSFSQGDDLHSRIEAFVEVALIVAGVAGVIAGVIAM